MFRCSRFFTACFALLLLLTPACQPLSLPIAAATPTPTAPPATPANIIRLTNGEWPPYLSENLPNYGLASHIVSAAFAQQGVTVEYGFFPWARSLALAQTGEWDGSVVWFKSPEREKDFYFSDPVIEARYVFFHLTSYAFDWQDFADLAGIRIGATIDYDYGPAFMEAEKAGQIAVERVPADEQNFDKLLAGRIDVFPLDLEVGLSMLRQNFSAAEIAQITYHPAAVRADPGYLLLSKNVAGNEAMMERFNAGLKALTESGELQQIIEAARAGK